jgi:hypothetical protein
MTDSLMVPSMAKSYQRAVHRQDLAENIAKTFEVSAEGQPEMDVTESIMSEDLEEEDDERVNFK